MSIASQFYAQVRAQIDDTISSEGLKARVFRGGAWLGLGSFTEQLFRFGRNIALTRMLAPEAFGVMAIVISTSGLFHTLTDIGVKDAVVQNPDGAQDRYIDAAYWLSFGRALSLYAGIFICSPWIARFYGNHELSILLRITSISIILDAAGSPGVFRDMKRLKLKKWAAITHGGGIGGVIITVVLSFFIRDVWALVIGSLSESTVRSIISYVLYPYIPTFKWDKSAFQSLLRFSRGLAGLSLLNLIFARTDIFVLAKLYPATQLGFYTMAVYLVQTPIGFIMNLCSQTLMPALSHIQGDKRRENRILIQVTAVIALVGLPALVFLYFCGHSLLVLFYGQRYGVAASSLIVAACVTLINLANAQITTVFYARGLPQLHRRCVIIMAVAMIVLILPFVKLFGLVGGQIACFLAVGTGYLFQVIRLRNLTDIDVSQYFRPFLLGAAVSLAVLTVCVAARPFPALLRPIPNISLGLLGCVLAYGLSAAYIVRNNDKVFA